MDTLREHIEKGIMALRQGGLVAYPTDTVYGLGADAFNESAVRRVYAVKERALQQALPLLVSGMSHAESIAVWTPAGRALAEHFWPGPLTIILPARSFLPSILTAGTGRVGVRYPNHPVPLALIAGLSTPLIGTSANRSGRPSVTTAGEVNQQLAGMIEFVIDGGRSPGGVESTVIDISGPKPRLIRAGAISEERISTVLHEANQLDNR